MANATILVVDDQPINVHLLKRKLEREKLEVLTANNGLEALEQVKARKPDLILLDLMLPRMSGFEFCRKLRGEGIQTPVLMLTARSEEPDRVLGLDLGADD